MFRYLLFFFFNDTATTEIYTLSLHDALPIYVRSRALREIREHIEAGRLGKVCWGRSALGTRHEDDARRLDDPARNVDPTWYYKPGGGPLRDAAVYDLHALTWMLGPARRVTRSEERRVGKECRSRWSAYP